MQSKLSSQFWEEKKGSASEQFNRKLSFVIVAIASYFFAAVIDSEVARKEDSLEALQTIWFSTKEPKNIISQAKQNFNNHDFKPDPFLCIYLHQRRSAERSWCTIGRRMCDDVQWFKNRSAHIKHVQVSKEHSSNHS